MRPIPAPCTPKRPWISCLIPPLRATHVRIDLSGPQPRGIIDETYREVFTWFSSRPLFSLH